MSGVVVVVVVAVVVIGECGCADERLSGGHCGLSGLVIDGAG